MIPDYDISSLKGVLFDLGGTLVRYVNNPSMDSYTTFSRWLDQDDIKISYHDFCVMIDTYWRKMQDEFYSASNILSIEKYNLNFLTWYGFSYSSVLNLVKRFDKFLWDLELDGTQPINGAKDLLECLKMRKYKLGLVSNASHSSERICQLLKKTGLDGYFQTVVVSSEFGIRKPDPRIFLKALDDLSLSVEDCIYIGDREDYDAEGAKNAGMRYIIPSSEITFINIMEWFKCKS
jgi:putative hydrolase of the HAD superfamily